MVARHWRRFLPVRDDDQTSWLTTRSSRSSPRVSSLGPERSQTVETPPRLYAHYNPASPLAPTKLLLARSGWFSRLGEATRGPPRRRQRSYAAREPRRAARTGLSFRLIECVSNADDISGVDSFEAEGNEARGAHLVCVRDALLFSTPCTGGFRRPISVLVSYRPLARIQEKVHQIRFIFLGRGGMDGA